MNDAKATAEATNEIKTTADTTKGATAGAEKVEKGEPDPGWKRFYTVLGQFNTIAVREANEDLKSATEKLIELTCLLDGRCSSFGPDYAWDEKAQKCVRVGAPTE